MTIVREREIETNDILTENKVMTFSAMYLRFISIRFFKELAEMLVESDANNRAEKSLGMPNTCDRPLSGAFIGSMLRFDEPLACPLAA
jgi:hypothetical protein